MGNWCTQLHEDDWMLWFASIFCLVVVFWIDFVPLDNWLQNWPFCKPSTVVEYDLPLNIFRVRNGTLAPLCVSLMFSNTVETILFLCLAYTTPEKETESLISRSRKLSKSCMARNFNNKAQWWKMCLMTTSCARWWLGTSDSHQKLVRKAMETKQGGNDLGA